MPFSLNLLLGRHQLTVTPQRNNRSGGNIAVIVGEQTIGVWLRRGKNNVSLDAFNVRVSDALLNLL